MFIIGLNLTIICGYFAFSAFDSLKKVSDYPHMYRLAYGMDEETLACLGIFAVILAAVGASMMFFSWAKNRNKSLMDSLKNDENDTYCNHCQLDVSSTDGKCPICGKELKER